MKKLDSLHFILLAGILVQGVAFWLTPYQLENFQQVPVRIHRLSGKVERLTNQGWLAMRRLEEEYNHPRYQDFIKKARSEGYSDLEIRQFLEKPKVTTKDFSEPKFKELPVEKRLQRYKEALSEILLDPGFRQLSSEDQTVIRGDLLYLIKLDPFFSKLNPNESNQIYSEFLSPKEEKLNTVELFRHRFGLEAQELFKFRLEAPRQ